MFFEEPYGSYGELKECYDIPIIKPNLATGEGHGHTRNSKRERPEKYHKQRKRDKRKAVKRSRRINRK